MARKIFRTGNSLVVSLPKDALEALQIGEGTEVIVDLDQEQRAIIISPKDRTLPGVDEEFARQVDSFIEHYRPALEELAKAQ